MAFEFLTQSPVNHDTTDKLLALLRESGRIFLLTGNFSNANDDKAAAELLSLIEWAASGEERELVVLVGVFKEQNEDGDWVWKTEKVAKTLAGLIVQAEKAYMARHPSPPVIDVPISFYAVKKWHAKVIGLTGKGKRFHDAQCAIFGSTNFSGSALHGDNFELDLFMSAESNGDELGKVLLNAFIRKVGAMLDVALKQYQIPVFHKMIQEEVKRSGSNFLSTKPEPLE